MSLRSPAEMQKRRILVSTTGVNSLHAYVVACFRRRPKVSDSAETFKRGV